LGRRGRDNDTKKDATIDRTVVATTIDETATMKIKIVVLNNLRQLLRPIQRNHQRTTRNSKHPRLLHDVIKTNDRTETKRWLSSPV
jgi:hypothetical protein